MWVAAKGGTDVDVATGPSTAGNIMISRSMSRSISSKSSKHGRWVEVDVPDASSTCMIVFEYQVESRLYGVIKPCMRFGPDAQHLAFPHAVYCYIIAVSVTQGQHRSCSVSI